ncbi:MAG TPA: prenyltransferase/squalene oxidase repeat-containing protein [Bacteroidia bacterium]|nr:prenyltransferase/squalene oxidase repeat-containing protein [Bacteroidia bacterium]
MFFLLATVGCGSSPTEAARQKGADFLAGIQREDGAICDTVNPLFDIWETVEAATAIHAVRKDTADPTLRKAMQFLARHENSAGLLCHNVKCRASYCLETTSEYFILLADMYGPQKIQSRMDTLRKLQKPSGEWDIGNPDVLENKAFPSVTAFVLAAFQAAKQEPIFKDAAWAWLLGQQNSEKNWGKSWEYYGVEAYALWPVMRAMRQQGSKESALAIQQAADYIFKAQQGKLQWDSGDPAQPKRISAELETALMLAAYPDLIGNVGHQATENGIRFLLERQQPDGHWDGGFFPIPNARYVKEEYVFATARAMMALEMKSHEQKGLGVME